MVALKKLSPAHPDSRIKAGDGMDAGVMRAVRRNIAGKEVECVDLKRTVHKWFGQLKYMCVGPARVIALLDSGHGQMRDEWTCFNFQIEAC